MITLKQMVHARIDTAASQNAYCTELRMFKDLIPVQLMDDGANVEPPSIIWEHIVIHELVLTSCFVCDKMCA